MTEPLVKTRAIKIAPTETPAPPWTGRVFFCDRCRAANQLEAGDVCMPLAGWNYLTPACPTPGCGHRSKIQLPESAVALLKIGLDPGDLPDWSATADSSVGEDWNAS